MKLFTRQSSMTLLKLKYDISFPKIKPTRKKHLCRTDNVTIGPNAIYIQEEVYTAILPNRYVLWREHPSLYLNQ